MQDLMDCRPTITSNIRPSSSAFLNSRNIALQVSVSWSGSPATIANSSGATSSAVSADDSALRIPIAARASYGWRFST